MSSKVHSRSNSICVDAERVIGMAAPELVVLACQMKMGMKLGFCWAKNGEGPPEIWIGKVTIEAVAEMATQPFKPATITFSDAAKTVNVFPDPEVEYYAVVPYKLSGITNNNPMQRFFENTEYGYYLESIWARFQLGLVKDVARQEKEQLQIRVKELSQGDHGVTNVEMQTMITELKKQNAQTRDELAEARRLLNNGNQHVAASRQQEAQRIADYERRLAEQAEMIHHLQLDVTERPQGQQVRRETGLVYAATNGWARFLPNSVPDSFVVNDKVTVIINGRHVKCTATASDKLRDNDTGDVYSWPPDQSVRAFVSAVAVDSAPKADPTDPCSWDMYLVAGQRTPTSLNLLRLVLADFYMVNTGTKLAEKQKCLDDVMAWAEMVQDFEGWKGTAVADIGRNKLKALARLLALERHLNLADFDNVLNEDRPPPTTTIAKALQEAKPYKEKGGKASVPSKSKVVCFNCNRPGHKSADCRSPKKDGATTGKPPEKETTSATAPPPSTTATSLNWRGGAPRN
jgi:hypothetical protein